MALILETQRLKIRSFQESDIQPFAAYRSHPYVAQYQSWETPYTLEQATQFVEAMNNSRPATPGEWYQLAIEVKTDGMMIGDCAFCILEEDILQAEIGFTLARAHQGLGYGSEAVRRLLAYLYEELALHRVHANCDVENVASIDLLERVGMRREAYFLESLWFKGRWSSEYWYGLLQREWMKTSHGIE